ncbi:MAG: S1 RNA-binding domain-containing protein [Oscillospiraceae bacterium]|nr:S1 RNA-binding domain-containing protein [Oscillospiraceae bacterium]
MKIGDILEGRVSGIQKFGVFVSFPDGKSGLVHISEISDAFVADVNTFVKQGQQLKVKVIGISPEGKIALSIKQVPTEAAEEKSSLKGKPEPVIRQPVRTAPVVAPVPEVNRTSDNMDFEDRLKKFMKESDSRIADNRLYSERPRKSRKR